MKKYLLPVAFLAVASFVQAQVAQEEIIEIKEKRKHEVSLFNKWSVEANIGGNNAIYNFSPGYHDAKILSPFHVDLGVRYMVNNKFGFKADFGYDKISSHGNSKDFNSSQMRVSLQGVLNVGRILSFEQWTNSIGLLAHAGPGYAHFKNDDFDKTDNMLNLMAGLTLQYKLSDKFVITGDVTGMNNIFMDYTWNGQSRKQKYISSTTTIPGQTVNGVYIPGQTITTQIKNPANDYLKHLNPLVNVSLGVTYYIGKKQNHADWFYANNTSDLEERVSEIEEMLRDDDNDGVANYLDLEPNSAPNAMVDTKGRTIDTNGNGIPDNIEKYIADNCKCSVSEAKADSNVLKAMIDSGLINVYFDYNKSTPFQASVGGIDFIVEFMKLNPTANMEIIGFADPKGGATYNQKLSQQRADAVKNIIVSKGISASRLTAKGDGIDAEFKNSSTSAYQLARRVIFRVK